MTKLNNEQQKAVMHRDGPMLVLAGPGSGKTAVLVRRLKFLVEEGIDPKGILVLTFSRAAAEEMEFRFRKEAGSGKGITFGTFHSIFYHILKSQGLYQRAKILTKDKKTEYMKIAAVKKGILKNDDLSFVMRLTELAGLKKMGEDCLTGKADEDDVKALSCVYDDYNRIVRDEGYIDFDDMIADCLKMLKCNEKIRRKWQERYPYILVDEFQDIDARQYEVLKMLAGEEGNIFCVGDDDQSIYSFRGAVPFIMRDFANEYHDIKKVCLSVNYRCPPEIIKHAGYLIKHNRNRFDKVQKSIKDDMGNCIVHRCFPDPAKEAEYCARMIEDILVRDKKGDTLPSVGVLYRISRSGDILEETFRHRRIAYQRKDKRAGFYEREWVKDILSYLGLTLCDRREDIVRILNRPDRGLIRECIGVDTDCRARMLEFFDDDIYRGRVVKLFDDIDFIKGMTPYGAVNYILKGTGLLFYFSKHYRLQEGYDDWEEITDELLFRARPYKSIREWLFNIERSDDGDPEDYKDTGPARVDLRTIHAAKGLEYDHVFMIGLQEGVFPLKKYDDPESLEEERRLFYVGMTRSKKKLWLTGIQRDEYGKRESRFIKEAGLSDETLGRDTPDVV